MRLEGVPLRYHRRGRAIAARARSGVGLLTAHAVLWTAVAFAGYGWLRRRRA